MFVPEQEAGGTEKPAVSQQALFSVSPVDVVRKESWLLADLLEVWRCDCELLSVYLCGPAILVVSSGCPWSFTLQPVKGLWGSWWVDERKNLNKTCSTLDLYMPRRPDSLNPHEIITTSGVEDCLNHFQTSHFYILINYTVIVLIYLCRVIEPVISTLTDKSGGIMKIHFTHLQTILNKLK